MIKLIFVFKRNIVVQSAYTWLPQIEQIDPQKKQSKRDLPLHEGNTCQK